MTSIILAALRRFKVLWATGILTMLCLGASLIAFQYQIYGMKHSATAHRDKLFNDLQSAAADAIQLGWGYAVLLLGSSLVLIAAAVGTGKLKFRR
jgi:hypothetical protein